MLINPNSKLMKAARESAEQSGRFSRPDLGKALINHFAVDALQKATSILEKTDKGDARRFTIDDKVWMMPFGRYGTVREIKGDGKIVIYADSQLFVMDVKELSRNPQEFSSVPPQGNSFSPGVRITNADEFTTSTPGKAAGGQLQKNFRETNRNLPAGAQVMVMRGQYADRIGIFKGWTADGGAKVVLRDGTSLLLDEDEFVV